MTASAVIATAVRIVGRCMRGERRVWVTDRLLLFLVSGRTARYRVKRQRAGSGRVIELCLARQHFETCDVEIELGARERAACVDELDLVDDALVALAAGDAKSGVCGVRPRGGGSQ